jgi:hypothetical protein
MSKTDSADMVWNRTLDGLIYMLAQLLFVALDKNDTMYLAGICGNSPAKGNSLLEPAELGFAHHPKSLDCVQLICSEQQQ